MALTVDPNVWYTILNNASNYYLAELTPPGTVNWQLLPPSEIDSAYPGQQFIMRPQGYLDSCLAPVPGTSSITFAVCDPSTALWALGVYINPDGGTGILIHNDTWGYLAATCATCDTLGLVTDEPSYPDSALFEFSLSSVSEINDDAWSTLPWISSTTSTTPTTTISTTSTTTSDISTTTSDTSTTSQASFVNVATSDSPPPSTTTTPDSYSTSTTSTDNSTPTSTADTTSASLSPSATSPSQAVTTYFSVVNQNLADVLGPTVASLLLPQHANVGCEKCIATGIIDVTTSDVDTSEGDIVAAAKFLEDGYIDMSISNFAAEIDLDFELLPGFQFAHTFLTLYNKTLKRISIGDDLTLEFRVAFGIPVIITLDSSVAFTGGFTIDISQANIHIDMSDISSSTVTGFDTSDLHLADFSVSAPNLKFTAVTGLAARIYATATVSAGSELSADGSIIFELDLPSVTLNTTVASNVDDDCKAGGSHKHAIDLSLQVDGKIHADGELDLRCTTPKKHVTLNSTEFGEHDFSISVPNENQCLYDSRLKAAFLGVVAALSGDSGGLRMSMQSWEVASGFGAMWLFILLWTEAL